MKLVLTELGKPSFVSLGKLAAFVQFTGLGFVREKICVGKWPMKDSIRKNRLLVDWRFQGALCLRISFYWLLCQTTLVAAMLGFLVLEA